MENKRNRLTFVTILVIVTLFSSNLRTNEELNKALDMANILQKENEYLKSQLLVKDEINNKLASEYNILLDEKIEYIKELEKRINEFEEQEKRTVKLGTFTVTCYDLSYQSTGKTLNSSGYGITASGFDLTGHTWQTARAIAVDPNVIPLGSMVKITFNNTNYSQYNGIYRAVDTGGAIKGNRIDLFLGDFNQRTTHQSCIDFGKTQANVEIIKEDK